LRPRKNEQSLSVEKTRRGLGEVVSEQIEGLVSLHRRSRRRPREVP